MSVGVAALLLAGIAQAGAEAPPPIVHEQRLDDVGLVSIATPSANASGGVTVAHRGLPADSFAEVTDLATGRTVIALVQTGTAPSADRIGSLSAGAAGALNLSGNTTPAVRIRPAVPSPAEQAAVRSGTVVRRLDAPSTLLAALRRRMPQPAAPVAAAVPPPAPVAPTPVKPAPRPAPQPAPAKAPTVARGRWFVQVATLSDAGRAATLAKSVDGVVRSAGRLYRVQAGPFATRAAAETARASIARRGFGDARIIAQD
ncbi:MAG: SPOR domain-containing protein [Sphingomonas paucimobilis]